MAEQARGLIGEEADNGAAKASALAELFAQRLPRARAQSLWRHNLSSCQDKERGGTSILASFMRSISSIDSSRLFSLPQRALSASRTLQCLREESASAHLITSGSPPPSIGTTPLSLPPPCAGDTIQNVSAGHGVADTEGGDANRTWWANIRALAFCAVAAESVSIAPHVAALSKPMTDYLCTLRASQHSAQRRTGLWSRIP